MASKKDTPKIELERTYNVPLRKEFMKVPRWKKTKKAVTALKQFLSKHMKSEDVKLGKEVNEELWKHGIKNPPHHIKVNVTKDSEGLVKAELFGVEKKAPTQRSKAPSASKAKLSAEKETKKDLKVKEEKPETKVEVAKKEESKQEQEALQKDQPEPKIEKLPEVKDEKSTQPVPSQKNQLN